MTGDRVPRNVWRTIDEAMDIEECNSTQLGDPKVTGLLLMVHGYEQELAVQAGIYLVPYS
jgi:hypothetical protein